MKTPRTTCLIVGVLLLFAVGCVTTNPTLDIPKDKINLVVEVADGSAVLEQNPCEDCGILCYSTKTVIHGDVAYMTMTMTDGYVATDLWRDTILLLSDNIKELVIYLDNPGGAAFAGQSIVDQLIQIRDKGVHIRIEARGIVASAAIPILAVGTERIASRSCGFLIHPATLWKWGVFSETMADLESQKTMMAMLKDSYIGILTKYTKMKAEDLEKMMEKDTWFTAEQAKDWGLIDSIQ